MARRRRGRRDRKGRSRRLPPGSPSRPSRLRRRRRILLIGVGTGAVVLAIALVWRAERTRVAGPADPETAEHVALGERLYAEHCASCHGAELEGQPNWRNPLPDGRYPAPPHDATGHTWHHDDAYLFDTTQHGGQATAPRGFVSGMPAFGDKLTNAEIRAILALIKSRWPAEIRARQGRAHR